MNNSLQRRLSVWLSIAIATTGILAAFVSFTLIHDDAKEFQDHMLRQIAMLVDRNVGIATKIEVPIQNRIKRVFGDSATWITVTRLPDDPRPAWFPSYLKAGFHTLETTEGRIRIFVLGDVSGKATVVAQPTRIRDEITMNSSLLALIPLLLLLPLMVWLTLRIVRSQFLPVNQLAAHLDAQPADRPTPLSDKDVPDEIFPFVQAINRLLQRVSDLTNQQRRFIADAAHELRSPLTALAIQVQNLKQSGTLEIMQERVLPLQAGIERSRKLTEQLLSLARTQAETLERGNVDILPMIRELIAEFLPLSEMKRIDFGLDAAEPFTLNTEPRALLLVLRNALENALKYAPEGGEVTIRPYSTETSYIIEIVDSGPGIPVSELERVFDPFYRLPEAAGEGSGLGLSIAREAAISLGGTVSLLNRPDGSGLIFRYQQPRKY